MPSPVSIQFIILIVPEKAYALPGEDLRLGVHEAGKIKVFLLGDEFLLLYRKTAGTRMPRPCQEMEVDTVLPLLRILVTSLLSLERRYTCSISIL